MLDLKNLSAPARLVTAPDHTFVTAESPRKKKVAKDHYLARFNALLRRVINYTLF